MDLNTLISVSISAASPSITKIGFGEPGLFGHVPTSIIPSSSRSRRYSSSTGLSDMVADGFATTDPLYLAAQAVLSQSPRPRTFKILCGRLDMDHDFTITPTTDDTNETIGLTIMSGGVSHSYTQTGGGAGIPAEATALAALLNAVGGWGSGGSGDFTATASTNDVVVTANTSNMVWYFDDMENVTISDETTDRGIAAEITAILTADSDWYELVPADAFGAAEITLLAASIQSATNKAMTCATQDSEVIAGSGIGQTLSTADRNRSSVIYTGHSLSEYPSAAISGRFLPEFPGTVTRSYKSLSGVTPTQLTAAQSAYAHADFVNTYEGIAIGGVTVVSGNLYKGWSSGSSETFMDTIRLIDALVAEVQTRVLSVFRGAKKIPFTDKGVGMIKGAILAAIKVFEATNPPGLTPGSEFCNVPAVQDISAADKAARHLPDVTFGAEIAGAVATVTINGTLEY